MCKQLGAPPRVEPGKICDMHSSVERTECSNNNKKSFEEEILDRMKGKPVVKRWMHLKTKITSDENSAELKMRETEKVRKKKKKQAAEDKKKEKCNQEKDQLWETKKLEEKDK